MLRCGRHYLHSRCHFQLHLTLVKLSHDYILIFPLQTNRGRLVNTEVDTSRSHQLGPLRHNIDSPIGRRPVHAHGHLYDSAT